MIGPDGQTCVGCGTRFVPSRPYHGEYCESCRPVPNPDRE